MLGPLPNLHAALVHFPIALLTVGILVDLVALIRPSASGMRRFASVILATGTILLVPTFLSGKQAGDTASSPLPEMQRILGEHADWATATLWFFLVLIAVRVVVEWKGRLRGFPHVFLALVGLAGGYLVFQTGEHGGELVFGMGVGVRPLQELPDNVFRFEGAASHQDSSTVGPMRTQDGGLHWELVNGSANQFSELFQSEGESAVRSQWISSDTALVFRSMDTENGFALQGGYLGDVSLEAMLRVPAQGGSVGLVHHWRNSENYDALIVESSEMRLVRVQSGREHVLDRAQMGGADAWHSYRVVGSGGHFRGYRNDELFVHGHAERGADGRVGFLLAANSTFELRRVAITPIGEEQEQEH